MQEKAEFVNVLEGLSASLRKNFGLIFCPPPFGNISNADAIIAYNVSKETFYEIGNYNYIPLIAVNCLVEDKLFFQITVDYSKLRRKADGYFKNGYTFVCLEPADSALKNEILKTFEHVVFIGSGVGLQKRKARNQYLRQTVLLPTFSHNAAPTFYTKICIHRCANRPRTA